MKAFLLWLSLALAAAAQVPWRGWDSELFGQAKKEKKLVLLNLEAVWCHWCHVMAHTTYADPRVVDRLRRSYLTVKVDQDSQPELSLRYEDYGWPATIIFDADGRELAKLSGYQEPKEMLALLDRLARDPRPVPDPEGSAPVVAARAGSFSPKLRTEMEARHFAHYDYKQGGFGFSHKFLNWNSVEYALTRNDARSLKMARQTLDGELNLVDPVWGGVYQYSDSGIWTSPHFEKVMDHQTGNLRLFSQAYSQLGDPRYLAAAGKISAFLTDFLTSPEGAFYTSMDADVKQGEHSAEYFQLDDAGRRRQGLPRIDQHCYARENGWAVEAQALYYGASDNPEALQSALRAGEWLIAQRQVGPGAFRHGDQEGPLFLGDQVACGRAFLALYSVTGDPTWLQRAVEVLHNLDAHFTPKGKRPGMLSGGSRPAVYKDENILCFRFANLLRQYLGESDLSAERVARRCLGFLAVPAVALEDNTGGVLQAEYESRMEAPSITIVGPKTNPECQAMFRTARKVFGHYRKLEWWDPAQPPPSPGLHYPASPAGVAYVCVAGQCSSPQTSEKDLSSLLKKKGILRVARN